MPEVWPHAILRHPFKVDVHERLCFASRRRGAAVCVCRLALCRVVLCSVRAYMSGWRSNPAMPEGLRYGDHGVLEYYGETGVGV
jgi:hypothetical protein